MGFQAWQGDWIWQRHLPQFYPISGLFLPSSTLPPPRAPATLPMPHSAYLCLTSSWGYSSVSVGRPRHLHRHCFMFGWGKNVTDSFAGPVVIVQAVGLPRIGLPNIFIRQIHTGKLGNRSLGPIGTLKHRGM